MKSLVILTALASIISAGGASAQYYRDAACVLFEDANFGGRSLEMGPDDAVNFRAGQFWNDRVSSVLVRRGCTLVAYEDSDMGGRSIQINRRVRNLGGRPGTIASRRPNVTATIIEDELNWPFPRACS